jgi:hypothetical protein
MPLVEFEQETSMFQRANRVHALYHEATAICSYIYKGDQKQDGCLSRNVAGMGEIWK